MSIINEAIRKARAESKAGDIYTPEPVTSNVEKKWIGIAIIAIIIVLSLFGSIFIYKNISTVSMDYASRDLKEDSLRSLAIKKEIQRVSRSPGVELRNSIELSGIVYGPHDRWAIINNKIVREGDGLLDGKVTRITEELVRIEQPGGKEIVLNLSR